VTNLQRRLKQLELHRRLKREPRMVTRFERLDGSFDFWESRLAEGDDDETFEVVVEYEHRPAKAPLGAR